MRVAIAGKGEKNFFHVLHLGKFFALSGNICRKDEGNFFYSLSFHYYPLFSFYFFFFFISLFFLWCTDVTIVKGK